MKPELKAYIDTWTLATWRRYLLDAYKGAEIGNQPLTSEQRKRYAAMCLSSLRAAFPVAPM